MKKLVWVPFILLAFIGLILMLTGMLLMSPLASLDGRKFTFDWKKV